MKVYNVVECFLGTDGTLSTEVHSCKTDLIADSVFGARSRMFCKKMGVEYVPGLNDIQGDGWKYSITIHVNEIQTSSTREI